MKVASKKTFMIIIIALIVIESSVLFLMYKSLNDKAKITTENKIIIDNNMFAIMVEDEDGNYQNQTTWPGDGYEYNAEKSGCVDLYGNRLRVKPEYNEGVVSVNNIKDTSYCYLYFNMFQVDLNYLCSDYSNIGSCIASEKAETGELTSIRNLSENPIGGLYRYQGLSSKVKNNYICFGVSSVADCIGSNYESGVYDPTKFGKYMYRIIGISEDGSLKLIKKEALEEKFKWYSSYSSSRTWPSSLIYSAINGSSFYNNTDYIPEGWSSKIKSTDWAYGTIEDAPYNADTVYNIEGKWTTFQNAYIGLMYLHDYLYAYEGGNPQTGAAARQSWISLYNNDSINLTSSPLVPSSDPLDNIEKTMSYSGKMLGVTRYRSWTLWEYDDSNIIGSYLNVDDVVRPVFYLNNTINIISGDGTATNPYIIG